MSCSEHDPDCREVLERIHAYLDGELDQNELQRIHDHLQHCPACLAELDLDRILKALLRRSCRCESAPESLRTRIIIQITEARQNHQS
ncbi:MAG: hypothetical protein QG608_182 [Actinomycetota bacterium]|nr:hypothetical protein [Actinomycetota bacterium]